MSDRDPGPLLLFMRWTPGWAVEVPRGRANFMATSLSPVPSKRLTCSVAQFLPWNWVNNGAYFIGLPGGQNELTYVMQAAPGTVWVRVRACVSSLGPLHRAHSWVGVETHLSAVWRGEV